MAGQLWQRFLKLTVYLIYADCEDNESSRDYLKRYHKIRGEGEKKRQLEE